MMHTAALLADVLDWVAETGPHEGVVANGVRGMGVLHATTPRRNQCSVYDPVISLVLQGRKEAFFGNQKLSYGTGDAVIIGQTMPILSTMMEATAAKPFVAVYVQVDLPILRSLYADLGERVPMAASGRGLEAGTAQRDLVDAISRLFRLSRDPLEEQALGAAALREVYFRTLQFGHAGALRDLMAVDSKASRVAKAIAHIHRGYRGTIKASELADLAGMSASVFYECFKDVTASTPLQFQKDLRLMEARQMLSGAAHPISQIAQDVGYESAAQFSREFSRKFGQPPRAFLGVA